MITTGFHVLEILLSHLSFLKMVVKTIKKAKIDTYNKMQDTSDREVKWSIEMKCDFF